MRVLDYEEHCEHRVIVGGSSSVVGTGRGIQCRTTLRRNLVQMAGMSAGAVCRCLADALPVLPLVLQQVSPWRVSWVRSATALCRI